VTENQKKSETHTESYGKSPEYRTKLVNWVKTREIWDTDERIVDLDRRLAVLRGQKGIIEDEIDLLVGSRQLLCAEVVVFLD
jgi:hypothetical protein